MKKARAFAVAALLLAPVLGTGAAQADDMLGSYVRVAYPSGDHHASERLCAGTALRRWCGRTAPTGTSSTAATATDEGDSWFRSNDQRADLERMLTRGGAMSASTRRAIVNGEPLDPGRCLPGTAFSSASSRTDNEKGDASAPPLSLS